MSRRNCKVAVLISGSGSNLQALLTASNKTGAPFSICSVISNRPDAYGLARAAAAGIADSVVDHHDFSSRTSFDRALIEAIDRQTPDLVVLAGFMRILTPEFVRHYRGRLLNIHPSLLPKYQGLHTHRRALQAGDSEHGATVHFVTEELDGGPPIVQATVPIQAEDTPETLANRVQVQEHVIYPLAVTWFAEHRLHMQGERALLDGTLLPRNGIRLSG
ncbi:phosphoribosylglycinamide formyltransferase [Microbulbifer sp. 2205BS26-8]|uniref:phosphoribosylglycinamide formyltransferase n=1 Tax=Microbulbifer sp. 2205BS26-8 TaxID=3064386 RepID=UPI00273D8380|nr:phosphoribosylglycinamide formyltransferase [Microbulbifer sp. 2205BS26-8]MDP5210888.1 phosphoribosylglycinamide formyltransferase [Microbulbifer sp. 2205BS26-8]